MHKMRIIIAGSRDFDDYLLLESIMHAFLHGVPREDIQIVSGAARGADTLGERYARENGLDVKKFIPDWSIGRHAGFLRNKEMARYATHCFCFWDEKSKGTKSMIELAEKYGLALRVINYTAKFDLLTFSAVKDPVDEKCRLGNTK